jgi:DNA/RNA-binding domain of Phe-tRNA-synthetase-like protein
MNKFIVDDKIFDSIPNLKIGVVIVRDINNTVDLDLSNEYQKLNGEIIAKFEGVELAEYPVIKIWRDIYKSFGEKKARSSIESLIRRTIKGNPVGKINPLVDIYNFMSLKHEMPCGGEDIDAITDDLRLTFATGNEVFIPLGSEERESPNNN